MSARKCVLLDRDDNIMIEYRESEHCLKKKNIWTTQAYEISLVII